MTQAPLPIMSPRIMAPIIPPMNRRGTKITTTSATPRAIYHFADREGTGVDRTVATGTGFAGQYGSPWAEAFETRTPAPMSCCCSSTTCPYMHVLHSGKTVIPYIYDTHFDGVERVRDCQRSHRRAKTSAGLRG